MSHKVLLVTTSQSRLGDDNTTAGSWLEELAAPYYTLLDAGCTVDIASVRGGEAPIDAASVVEPWLTDHGRRLLDDARTMKRLLTTPSLQQVRAADYDAVFLVGGAAVMGDFPHDGSVGTLLREALDGGRIAGGVCHGVAGFLNPGVVSKIAGRRMTCISDREDALAGYDRLVPFMPESPLRAAGAMLSFAAEPFGCHAVRDGRLVTGQNPASAARCATLILEALAG
ncbi:MAG: ThiJ/PfpI domain protein [Panacagrimonas sp.]|jgi:putative intracellular protease/amidase|nr:type 1 glutamine amidotransferase domain-containing protein [Panacagrimonas sp.]MCC2655282.1 ThiJ/PfpI domain protein [Panacagrimonas sp.]